MPTTALHWTRADPGIALFAAVQDLCGAQMPFTGAILEIGCCETDWLHEAAANYPDCHFTGVDTRTATVTDCDGHVDRIRANALRADLFPANSFDAIVSLSAIEHFGLTHYKDPPDVDGDTHIMANAFRWLKPGGWIYFDVPYDPTRAYTQGTEYRVYDDSTLNARVWHGALAQAGACVNLLGTFYSPASEFGVLIDKPTVPAPAYTRQYFGADGTKAHRAQPSPFYYVSLLGKKC